MRLKMTRKILEHTCPLGLVNTAGSSVTICDDCGIELRKSKWRNVAVFESTSKNWYDGFLCVRCTAKSNLAKERFVNRIKRQQDSFWNMAVKKADRLGYYCELGNHDRCINSYIDCSCKCHID